jgi:hypothetical protein
MIYLLAALATYRLTRLVTADSLLEPVRERLEVYCENRGWFRGVYLLNCDWCLSIWFAPVPVVAVTVWPESRFVLVGLLVLSCSAVAGLLSTWERSRDV